MSPITRESHQLLADFRKKCQKTQRRSAELRRWTERLLAHVARLPENRIEPYHDKEVKHQCWAEGVRFILIVRQRVTAWRELMLCFCCGTEIDLARKVKIRRPVDWTPSKTQCADWQEVDMATYTAYTEQWTYRWGVVCHACYRLLDNEQVPRKLAISSLTLPVRHGATKRPSSTRKSTEHGKREKPRSSVSIFSEGALAPSDGNTLLPLHGTAQFTTRTPWSCRL